MCDDTCYVCYETETHDKPYLSSNVCGCGQTYKIHVSCFTMLQDKNTCSICKQEYKGIGNLDIRRNGLRLIFAIDNLGFREEYTVDDKGRKHGVHKIWYHNGNLWEENFYQKGLRNGIQKLYSVNGELYRELQYDHGNRV
jgi:hypothetical protein